MSRLQLTETRKITALIAVSETVNRYRIPALTAGRTSGSVTRRSVVNRDAPRPREASSSDGSSCRSDAMIDRIPVASYRKTQSATMMVIVPVRTIGPELNAIRYAIPSTVPGRM